MIVRFIKAMDGAILLHVERQQGKINSINPLVAISDSNMSHDEMCTMAWLNIRETVYASFDAIWNARITPQMQVYTYNTEFEQVEGVNPETQEPMMLSKMCWGGRKDSTPLNEDILPGAIPPRDEIVTFAGFTFIPPVATRITRNEMISRFTKNTVATIMADVFDQYGQVIKHLSPIKVDTSTIGKSIVSFKHEKLTLNIDVDIIPRVLTELEKMQVLIANQIGGAYK